MGYNNEHARGVNLYFDIETVANPAAVALLGPVKPDSRLKDPAKIAASLAEKEAARIERGALDCDTAQVVCIGWAVGDADPQCLTLESSDEAWVLDAFWTAVAMWKDEDTTGSLVGFNNLGFDLPVLLRRSQVLKVYTPTLEMGRYKHHGIVDVMQALTWDGLVDAKGLGVYCRLFGLDVPADVTSGADVAGFVAGENWLAVSDHCRIDVIKTRALARRIGY